jgi:predicted nucleic acid-binding protein
MAYLIDSDRLIDFLKDEPGAFELLDGLAGQGIAISVITYMECYEGIAETVDPAATEAKFEALAARIPILPVSLEVARECAGLRRLLRQAGRRVKQRSLDLLIAATARSNGLKLVTRNKADYSDIPGLEIYEG